MITKNGKVYRNLQEQVSYLTNLYNELLNINKVGIKVIDKVESEDALYEKYPIGTEGLEYGDAVLVGETTDFVMYVYTRPFEDELEPHWLNIGQIGVQGPQGIQGEPGLTGPMGQSTRWYAQNSDPSTVEGYNTNDLWLNLQDGSVLQNRTTTWVRVGVIRGAQGVKGEQGDVGPQGPAGPQGPQGPTGDVGGFIHIASVIANISQAPRPADLHDLTLAYLVGTAQPYNLWIQVGDTSATAAWTDMGILNVATYITVNGQFQNVWDADTKVDKINNTQNMIGLYGVGANSTDNTLYYASKDTTGNTIAMRTEAGKVKTTTPTVDDDAANKKYVDDIAITKATKPNLINKYGREPDTSTADNWYYKLDLTNQTEYDGNVTISLSQTVYAIIIYNYAGGIQFVQSGTYIDKFTFSLSSYTSSKQCLVRIMRGSANFDTIKIMCNLGEYACPYTQSNEPAILWKESSPTAKSSFTITLPDINKFKYLVVVNSLNSGSLSRIESQKIENTNGKSMVLLNCYRGNIYNRVCTVSSTGLTFDSAYIGANANNDAVIPIEVWGTNTL